MQTLLQMRKRRPHAKKLPKKLNLAVGNETPAAIDEESQTNLPLVPLVGTRCNVACLINDIEVTCLWDTGSQVSMMSEAMIKQLNLDKEPIKDVGDLISHPISLESATQDEIKIKGFIPLTMSLKTDSEKLGTTQKTPFIITYGDMKTPILGSNVIPFLIEGGNPIEKLKNMKNMNMDEVLSNAISTYLKTISSQNDINTGDEEENHALDAEIESRNEKPFNTLLPEELEGFDMLHTYLKEISFPYITDAEESEMKQMLWEERNAFSKDPGDIGNVEELQMSIKTHDNEPVVKNYNAIPKPLQDHVKKHIEDMLRKGWIQKSKSAWSSPIVLAKKKDGTLRACNDYRLLNIKTISDRHPLPRIQETIDSLQGSTIFTTLDLSKAYHQGYLTPESRPLTAFATPWGFYEWVRIPFGLKNAVACFQRFMEECLQEERNEYCMPYLDDTIVYSSDTATHIQHVRNVLRKFQQKKLKLNIQKCNFCTPEVEYLGRLISKDGYRLDDRSIRAVTELKDRVFETVGDIRKLFGLLSFHRRHIQNFAAISKPLADSLMKENIIADQKDIKINAKGVIASSQKITWTPAHQQALETLIDVVTKPPILSYANFDADFFVHVDTSGKGLGAILYQQIDDKIETVAYASRSLKPAEQNYHSTKLEFLAMKWAITHQFSNYLAYAESFKVFTDNNPLLYVMGLEKPNATTQRWVSDLADYNFSIHYRPGTSNTDADCLSRMPLDIRKYVDLCTEETSLNSFQEMVERIEVVETPQHLEPEMDVVEVPQHLEPEIDVSEAPQHLDPDMAISVNIIELLEKDQTYLDMKEDQDNDPYIQPIKDSLSKSAKAPNKRQLTKTSKQLLKEKTRLFLDEDGLLWRKYLTGDQIVLPLKHRKLIYELLHSNLGHIGSERTYQMALQRVWWPGMKKDIEDYVRNQCVCRAQRTQHRPRVAPLVSIHSAGPLDLVAIDFLHLEKASNGCEYILLITDHFTRFTQAYATTNKSALTAAKKLFGEYIPRFGIPARLLHDQGREFENQLFHHLEKYCGMIRSRTSPYHPMTNGACERMNSTVLQMLRTLPENEKSKWPDKLNYLMFIYNSTEHSTTKMSPYFLMFGRKPLLPIDFKLTGVSKRTLTVTTYRDYVRDYEKRMQEAYYLVKKYSSEAKDKSEQRWRKRCIANKLKVGDRVLVRNKREQGGPGKIRSYWEQKIYQVIEEVSENTVYRVKAGKEVRVLHRNLLLPCNDMEELNEPEQAKRQPHSKPKRNSQKEIQEDSSDDSDEEVLYPLIPHQDIQSPEITEIKDQEDPSMVDESNDDHQMSMENILTHSLPPDIDVEHNVEREHEVPETVEPDVQGNTSAGDETSDVEQNAALEAPRRSCRLKQPVEKLDYQRLGGNAVAATSTKNKIKAWWQKFKKH